MQEEQFTFSRYFVYQFHRFFLMGFFVCGWYATQAQEIGIYSDIYLGETAAIGLHNLALQFNQGVVKSTSIHPGRVVFFDSSQHFNAANEGHIETLVQSQDQLNFIYPVGDRGVFQPLAIDSGSNASLAVQFHFDPPPPFLPFASVDQISPNFYWSIAGDKIAHVQLSWSSNAHIANWVEDLSTLRIVGYTGTAWEMIPAQLTPFALSSDNPTSLTEGAIRSQSTVDLSRYTILSLGAIAFDTSLKISQAITPNGDGINDVWFIENIDRYPQASIRVYNRWGAQVFFRAGQYKNDWGGTFNNDPKPLPPAPYYYRIDLDSDGEIEHEGWLYINH